jgi:hypothetical protein
MQSESIELLAKALVKAQSEFSAVPKGSNNPFFKSKYAALPEVVSHTTPILSANGLAISQHIGADELITYLLHESGQYIAHAMTLHLPKQDPQGQGSAVTYARRYAYMSALGLVADEDDDGNRASQSRPAMKQEPKKATPVDTLRDALSKKFKASEERQAFLEERLGRKLQGLGDISDSEIAGLLVELA